MQIPTALSVNDSHSVQHQLDKSYAYGSPCNSTTCHALLTPYINLSQKLFVNNCEVENCSAFGGACLPLHYNERLVIKLVNIADKLHVYVGHSDSKFRDL